MSAASNGHAITKNGATKRANKPGRPKKPRSQKAEEAIEQTTVAEVTHQRSVRRSNGEVPKRGGIPSIPNPENGDVPHFNRCPITLGRPIKLTEEIIADVQRLLPAVRYIDTVGEYLTIHRGTMRIWLRRGGAQWNALKEDPQYKVPVSEQMFLKLYTTYKQARAAGEVGALQSVNAAMGKDWRAAVWYLKAINQKRWGDRSAIEVTGTNGSEIKQVQIFLPENGRNRPPIPIVQQVAQQTGNLIADNSGA